MFGRASGLGLCLAIVLMLAVSGGAVAQETTDSDGVYTALVNEPCGIDIDHTSGTFGTWQWDGTKYAVPPTRST